MENSLETIQILVNKIKALMLESINNPCLRVSPSAYDTAWLAMIQNPNKGKMNEPLFIGCLDWILENQKPQGFWGEYDCHGNPTIDSLPTTLACMVALNKWGVGHEHVQRGMAFISANSTNILEVLDKHNRCPRWFTIVFPGMVQLARRNGLLIEFADDIKHVVARVLHQRHFIFTTEKVVDKFHYPPLLSCLEVLPERYQNDHITILKNLDDEGSLFQSPSATAAAFMATRSQQTLSYLHRVVDAWPVGVPPMYPIDEDCIKLYMVNQLQRLGLSEHFSNEINEILEHIYRKTINAQEPSKGGLVPRDMFKDTLAFHLLRLNGYNVSPGKLCRFLDNTKDVEHIEKNYKNFSSVLLGLYRATNLMFQGEVELQELRSFSRRLLVKSCERKMIDDDILMWPHLQEEINYEIVVPWFARMDHLEHRRWIEANMKRPLWLGKASFYRIPGVDNMDLLQLAQVNYEHRQEIYKIELEELIRWSNTWRLKDMGFAREKTTYCYFAIASCNCLPYNSKNRLIITKSAVIVTIIDDFFDMEGSLDELHILTQALQKWDDEGLWGHSKIIFDVLDNFINDLATEYFCQHNIDIIENLRHLWYETFESWLMEATWSKTGQIPSMETYLENGMISIAAHTILLPASYFMMPSSMFHKLNHSEYQPVTKYLMMACRLLNDLQSYEKEQKDGKFNSVLLYMKENPNASLEDAICYVQSLLDQAKTKLLELSLSDDGHDDLPKSFKMMHLHCLKVFQMFFNSANYFDSKDSLLNDINKAIYEPLESFTSLEPPTPKLQEKKKILITNSGVSTKLQEKKKILITNSGVSFHDNLSFFDIHSSQKNLRPTINNIHVGSTLKNNQKWKSSSSTTSSWIPRILSLKTHHQMRMSISPYNFAPSIL